MPSKESSIAGMVLQHSYKRKPKAGVPDMYCEKMSLFHQRHLCMSYFSITSVRHKPASKPDLADNGVRVEMRRAGHVLLSCVAAIELSGIVAYSASPATGMPNTNGWLDADSSLQIQPQFKNYAALIALCRMKLEIGGIAAMDITNDAVLDLTEVCGVPGRSTDDFLGVHGGAAAPWDLAKEAQLFLVPLPAFFSHSAAAAMPSSVQAINGANWLFDFGSAAQLLEIPSYTQGDISGTSTALLYGTGTGQFQVYCRPIVAGAGIAWGSAAPSNKADNANLLVDFYVICRVAQLSRAEASALMEHNYSQHVPMLKTEKKTFTSTNAADKTDAVHSLSFAKKDIQALMVHARQAGADFGVLDCGAAAEAPTVARPIVKAVHLRMDDAVVVDISAEEAKLDQYHHFSSMTNLPIVAVAFASTVHEFNPMGSLPAFGAGELEARYQLNKEAFSSSGSSIEVAATILYWGSVSYIKGQAALRK